MKSKSTHSHSSAMQFAFGQNLRPWPEVAAEWHRRSGQRLTRARAFQIAKRAEEKMREQLLQDPELADLFGPA